MLRPRSKDADAVARLALRDAGLPWNGLLRHASSTNNMVFLSGNNIVRINRNGKNRLQREALLCQSLPNLPWTPSIVADGTVDDSEYLIVEQKPGSPLARWWPDMRESQRDDAIEQLAACMRAIHFTEIPEGLKPLDSPPQMLGNPSNPILPILQGLQRLRNNRHVGSSVVDELETKVLTLAPSIDDYTDTRAVHGDLTFENVLWDGSTITAVLDFEWARGAPRDLDLDVICRFIQWPHLHVDPVVAAHTKPSDYEGVLRCMARSYPELFSHRNLRQRLALYGIAFELRATLQNQPNRPVDDLGPLHPYTRLLDAATTGGPGARMAKTMFS